MDKSLVIHAVLAAVSTAGAYAAWSAPKAMERDDSVIMVAGAADHLQRINWHDESTDVAVERDASGTVTVTVAHPNVAGAAGVSETAQQVYPGSARAKELFDKVAPLKAARSLGHMPAERLKSFGLDAPKNKLTLNFGTETQEVAIGSTTYGSGDFYAMAPDGVVYILRNTTVVDLEHGAVALQDRDLVGVPRPKIDRVVAQAGTRRREFVQRQADDAAKAYFADPAEPDHKLEQVSTWLDRAMRLRATELVKTAPTGEPTLTLEFFTDHDSVATVKLWSTDKGAVAQSTRFKAPVNLHKPTVDAVLHDLDAILGGDK